MPRISAEERAALVWKTSPKVPRPPADLSRPAKQLWRAIANSKPPWFWTPTQCELLRRFVRTSAHADRLADHLEALPIGSTQALKVTQQMLAINTGLGVLAAKMRLTGQAEVTPRSVGQRAERGLCDSPLIGGHAIDRR